jgi:hypothetical protein
LFIIGSSASYVADMVLEAVTYDNPKARYHVGEVALKMVEREIIQMMRNLPN